MSESIRKQTFSGVKWTTLESFSTQIIGFVISVILARLLNPSDYGILGLLGIFMAISQSFISSGFPTALIRKINLTDTDCCTAFYFNIIMSFICYAILFLSSSLIANFFNTPILTEVIKVYCLTLIIGSLESVHRTRLIKNLEFKSLAKVNVITSITSGIIGITLAYMGWGIWALVWQSILNGIFHVALIWIVSKWKPSIVFSITSFKELFSFGSKLLVSGLLHNAYTQITPLIIGKFFTASDLGQYTRGTNYATLPKDTICGILQSVTFPILAKIQNDTERLINVYRKYIRSTSMLIVFTLILLGALAKPIVLIMVTEKWSECIIYLQIYIFSVCFDHIQKLNVNLLNIVGRSDLILKLEVYKKTISTLILLASIPFGVLGICISKVIYEQIALAFNTYYSGKLFKLGYFKQMKDYIPYLIISGICCLPAYLLTFTQLPYFIMILVGGLVSTSLYIGALYLKKDIEFIDLALPFLGKFKKYLAR